VKKAIVLGSNTFIEKGVKVGIHYIAEYLSTHGYEVHYISASSSVADLFSKSRRTRFENAWLRRYDKNPVKISDNLYEHIIRTVFPNRDIIIKFDFQVFMQGALIPKDLLRTNWDLLVTDTSPNAIFASKFITKKAIFRLSDLPEGFTGFPLLYIDKIKSDIKNGFYDKISAVSHYLGEYAKGISKDIKIEVLPNGIELGLYKDFKADKDSKKEKSAIFVGSISDWVDVDLIIKSAKILSDWTFDIYGPVHIALPKSIPSNVHFKGKVDPSLLPQLYSQYTVGLIPFVNKNNIVDSIEKPIKYYEYLASGLGIASTDCGGLRKGMGKWASYGNTPEEFANAIINSYEKSLSTSDDERWNYLEQFEWEALCKEIIR